MPYWIVTYLSLTFDLCTPSHQNTRTVGAAIWMLLMLWTELSSGTVIDVSSHKAKVSAMNLHVKPHWSQSHAATDNTWRITGIIGKTAVTELQESHNIHTVDSQKPHTHTHVCTLNTGTEFKSKFKLMCFCVLLLGSKKEVSRTINS